DHPPLELLFTVDEERGLHGAAQLELTEHIESRHLINLDSEDEAIFFVGCAGGIDIDIDCELQPLTSTFNSATRVSISGLRGGHSGIHIHERRLNAVQAILDILREINGNEGSFPPVLSLQAGTRKNALARSGELIIGGDKRELCRQAAERLRRQWLQDEPNIAFHIEMIDGSAYHHGYPPAAIECLNRLPLGVIRWEPKLPGVVRTSSNLGLVNTTENTGHWLYHARSSSQEELLQLVGQYRDMAQQAGLKIDTQNLYPGWLSDPDHPWIRNLVESWQRFFASEPDPLRHASVTTVHAGLEAGILTSKIPDCIAISFGPEIHNAHSPDERMSLSSAARTYRFLLHILAHNAYRPHDNAQEDPQ
ncbi:MAG: M20/M25/M40 family metallo-hydrolase, partial [Lentisphaerae bacterium]